MLIIQLENNSSNKVDNNGDHFLWQPIQWLQYGMAGRRVFFKLNLNEWINFKAIKFVHKQ